MSDDRLVNAMGEAALLGAMMLENRIIADWAGRLRVEDFSSPLHGRIYNTMLRYVARQKKADPITLLPVFQNDSDCDYGKYLDKLVDSPSAVVGASHFAKQIIDLAARRQTREAMHNAIESLALDFDKPIAEIAGQVEETVWAADSRGDVIEMLDLGDLVGMVEERDERINANPGTEGLTNALIPDIERMLGNPEAGTLMIGAGRPGMGKTSFGTSAGIGWAMNGHPGMIFLLEGKGEKHATRVTADLSHALRMPIEQSRLKKGGLSALERKTLAAIRERAALLPLKVVPLRSGTDIRQIWARVAREKAILAARGVKLEWVVIDQLSLCGASNAEGKEIEKGFLRMSAVSKVCREKTDELDMVTLALAQLGRDVDKRPDHRPNASDLKESGSLEEDADAVLLLYREEVYHRQNEPKKGEEKNGKNLWDQWEIDLFIIMDKIELIVGKSRYSMPRPRQMKFLGKYFAIRSNDVATDPDPTFL